MQSRVEAIERIIGREVGRGSNRLVQLSAGSLYNAAQSLVKHLTPRVAICTGFYIPQSSAPETDGPVGAALLAAGLIENDVPVTLMTDNLCHDVISAAAQTATNRSLDIRIHDPTKPQKDNRWTHFISIERAGPAKNGRVYNMSGIDITDTTPDMHTLYSSGNWRKIGIGDGGNEIGMGLIPTNVIAEDVQHGSRIACVVPCDDLIVAGVSNWGAWGLLAALMLMRPDWNIRKFLQSSLALEVLHQCVKHGAVDGVTKRHETSVDGIQWDVHQIVLEEIMMVCEIDK